MNKKIVEASRELFGLTLTALGLNASTEELPWKTRVIGWARKRNLIDGSTPILQMKKLREEVQELEDALKSGNHEEIVDAIGDIQVVLAIQSGQLGIDIDECREESWNAIKDRKGRVIGGVFVKEKDLLALRDAENLILKSGVDGGEVTSNALDALRDLEIKIGVHGLTDKCLRWQDVDDL